MCGTKVSEYTALYSIHSHLDIIIDNLRGCARQNCNAQTHVMILPPSDSVRPASRRKKNAPFALTLVTCTQPEPHVGRHLSVVYSSLATST